MIPDIEYLKKCALKLNLTMNEEEYETLREEFKVFIPQMELIGKIKGIENVEPMTHPFEMPYTVFREDEATESLSKEDAFKNAKEIKDNSVKVPKVVGE